MYYKPTFQGEIYRTCPLFNSPTAPTPQYNIGSQKITQRISPHTTTLQTNLNNTAYKRTANYITPQNRTKQ